MGRGEGGGENPCRFAIIVALCLFFSGFVVLVGVLDRIGQNYHSFMERDEFLSRCFNNCRFSSNSLICRDKCLFLVDKLIRG